jgi:hypothetical protein
MVKLYATLLSLTLTTSLALALPHPRPSYTDGLDLYDRDLLERDLDDSEEFSRREYLSDASDDLAARDPNFFGSIGHAFKEAGNIAGKALHVAEAVADNPIVQAAATVIPGGAVAEKVIGTIEKVEKFEQLAQKAKDAGRKTLNTGKPKHLGGAIGKVNNAIKHTNLKQVRKIASAATSRRHRRDLEDDQELSRRDLDAEELFRREYDDFLAERDFLNDLD